MRGGAQRLCCVLTASAFISVMAHAAWGEEARSGKELFQIRCSGCHSLDADKVGPRLRGIFEKPAGTVQSFNYSVALKNSRITWDQVNLDKWLADPDTVIPDNDMSFRLENSRERAAIIEYLRHLPDK